MKQALGPQRLDARRIELEMLEAPAYFIAVQCTFSELLLRNANGLDIENAVDDPEVVINAADALFVFEVALVGAVYGLHDLLDDWILRTRRLRRDGDIAFGGVAGRDDVFLGVRPDVADDVIGWEGDFLRRLERHRIHHAPAAQHDIVGLLAPDRQPLRLLFVAGMRHFDLNDSEAVFLSEQIIDGNRLTTVRRAVIEHDDLLPLQLLKAALAACEIIDDAGSLAVRIQQERENVGEYPAIGGIGSAVVDG